MNPLETQLRQLEAIDFTGKAEAFVESRFLTPLLECLGYETHKDYEVLRHGDDGASFKLSYPPVERGAQKVKHYNPDYVPTIRKKMFWIIEAKSPKDVPHPFDVKYLVQGLQYCIHPEIQAQHLLVTNGVFSSVFDAHGAVFLGQDMYRPVLEFRASELSQRWPEIYDILGVEKLRTRIEVNLKSAYDKLCLSSLDRNYPRELLNRIGASAGENAQTIAKTVNRMYVEQLNAEHDASLKTLESFDAEQIFACLDDPMCSGPTTQAHIFIRKSRAAGIPEREMLHRLTHDYARQSLFRKEQSFLGVCVLYLQTDDIDVMTDAKAFLDTYKDAELPLLNQVECAFLRLVRKSNVLQAYPKLQEQISQSMQSAPELVRFVNRPSALSLTYGEEILLHHRTYKNLAQCSDAALEIMLEQLLRVEAEINERFWKARKALPSSEIQLLGFEIYGAGGRHYSFRGVLHNYGIEQRPDIVGKSSFTPNTPKALRSAVVPSAS
jgi:hypothetical protein